MKWHGITDELPSPRGRNFIDMLQNSFVQYVYFCIPLKHFFNIVNFAGIESHLKFTFTSHFSTHLQVWMPISVYIFTYFCLGMLGIDSGWSDMTWQTIPLISDWRLQWHFNQMDTTLRIWHSAKLTFMSDVWVLLHFTEYFSKCSCHYFQKLS